MIVTGMAQLSLEPPGRSAGDRPCPSNRSGPNCSCLSALMESLPRRKICRAQKTPPINLKQSAKRHRISSIIVRYRSSLPPLTHTDGVSYVDPVTEEEQAQKEAYLDDGFPDWSRCDFRQLTRALEANGWYVPYSFPLGIMATHPDCTGRTIMTCSLPTPKRSQQRSQEVLPHIQKEIACQ